MPNLKDLSYKRIRKTIGEDIHRIEIYNPTAEDRQKLIEYLKIREDKTMKISGTDFVKHLLPLLTNIDLSDLEEPVIEEIINEPSEVLLLVLDEIEAIIKEILDRVIRYYESFNSLLSAQTEVISKMPDGDAAEAVPRTS